MVFEKTLATAEAALQVDEIVLVKGRVDHKEGGKVMRARPERRALRPLRRRDREAPASTRSRPPSRPSRCAWCVDGERLPVTVIEELKRIIEDFPGETRARARGHTASGPRLLKFGNGYRVAERNASLKPELRPPARSRHGSLALD